MAENTTAMTVEEKMQKASTTLATMLDYLGLDATVKAENRDGRIALIAVSEDAGRIIGRKGQTLDQLQLLVNRMVQKHDTESPRISIDVDGYSRNAPRERRGDRGERGASGAGAATPQAAQEDRPAQAQGSDRDDRGGDRGGRGDRGDRGPRGGGRGDRGGSRGGDRGGDRSRSRDGGGRRSFDDREPRAEQRESREMVESEAEHEQRIRQQALDAAKEVKRWGDSVSLPPMNSHDRRIVHLTLKDDPEINNESHESDTSANLKSVSITLNKKD